MMAALPKQREGIQLYRNLLELMFNAHSEHVSAKSYLDEHGSEFFTDKKFAFIIDQLDDDRLKKMFTLERKISEHETFLKYLPESVKLMFSQNLDIFLQAINQIRTKGLYNNIITKIQTLNNNEELRRLINFKEPDTKELLPTIDLDTALKNQPKDIEKHCATEISPMKYQNENPLEITEDRQKYLSDSSQQLLKVKNTREPLKKNDPNLKIKNNTRKNVKSHQQRRRDDVKRELRRFNENDNEVKDFYLDTEKNESNDDEMENEEENLDLEGLNTDEKMNQDVENETDVDYSPTLNRLEEYATENTGLKTEIIKLTSENTILKTEKEWTTQQQEFFRIELEMTNKKLNEKQYELDYQKNQNVELEKQITELKSLREIEDRTRDNKIKDIEIRHNKQIEELENEIEDKKNLKKSSKQPLLNFSNLKNSSSLKSKKKKIYTVKRHMILKWT